MKRKRRNNKTENMRYMLIMINAAVVLVLIIIMMIAQLVRLNRENKSKMNQNENKAVVSEEKKEENKDKTKTDTDHEETTQEEQSEPEDSGEKIVEIRTDLDPKKPMVAFTFDDGPYPLVTNRLVKIFDQNNGRATFNVVANRLARYGSATKNAYKHGNQIASHTFSHANLSKMKKKEIEKEMRRAEAETKKCIGVAPDMLRPPYGAVSNRMKKIIPMPMICWNVDSEDWKSRNKKSVIKKCKNVKDGDIILCHDLYPSTAAALRELLPKLRKKGYQFVTVKELFYYKGIEPENGKVYFDAK